MKAKQKKKRKKEGTQNHTPKTLILSNLHLT